MRGLLAKIRNLFNSLLLKRVKPWKRTTEEEFVRTIFDCLRNTVLCALVMGFALWIRKNASPPLPVFYKIFLVSLVTIGLILMGLNILYFDLRMRRQQVPRVAWLLAMLFFIVLTAMVVSFQVR